MQPHGQTSVNLTNQQHILCSFVSFGIISCNIDGAVLSIPFRPPTSHCYRWITYCLVIATSARSGIDFSVNWRCVLVFSSGRNRYSAHKVRTSLLVRRCLVNWASIHWPSWRTVRARALACCKRWGDGGARLCGPQWWLSTIRGTQWMMIMQAVS